MKKVMKVVIIKGDTNDNLFITLEKLKKITGNSACAIARTSILEYYQKILKEQNGTETNQSKSG